MNTRISAAITAALLAAALTACGGSPTPAPTKTVTAQPSVAPSPTRQATHAELAEQCIAAAEQLAYDTEGLTQEEQDAAGIPPECDKLPADEQMTAVFEGYMRHNQANRDEQQRLGDIEASKDAAGY